MPATWLLLLGSNLDRDERVQAALLALGALGAVTTVTAIRRVPGRGTAPTPDYYNALATLDSALERPALLANLKRIERELGREHGTASVAIDIDLLARRVDSRWQADGHARAKGDLGEPPVPGLLKEAGIVIEDTR